MAGEAAVLAVLVGPHARHRAVRLVPFLQPGTKLSIKSNKIIENKYVIVYEWQCYIQCCF